MEDTSIFLLTESDQEALKYTYENLSRLFTENLARMNDYKKRLYMPAIQAMCETYVPVLKVYHTFCKEYPDRGHAAAQYCAAGFMKGVSACITSLTTSGGFKNRINMESYRMIMAAFVVPALKEMKAENGQELVDEICRLWEKEYPSFPFQQTDAATLQKGFRLTLFG